MNLSSPPRRAFYFAILYEIIEFFHNHCIVIPYSPNMDVSESAFKMPGVLSNSLRLGISGMIQWVMQEI